MFRNHYNINRPARSYVYFNPSSFTFLPLRQAIRPLLPYGKCVLRSESAVLTILQTTSLLKSYHALIGRRYPKERTIITSPNMKVLPESTLLGVQNIRLREGLHFGEHDPCFAPQPFNLSLAPYLALIPFPGTLDHKIFWVCPTEEEFEPIAGQRLSPVPLGRISESLVTTLEKCYLDMVASPRAAASKNDPKGREYRTRIRILSSRLLSPATFQQALVVWRLIQRNCLELHAHITWTADIKPIWGTEHAWKTEELAEVVGAITDKREIVEYCFRVSDLNVHSCVCTNLLLSVVGWYSHMVLPDISERNRAGRTGGPGARL